MCRSGKPYFSYTRDRRWPFALYSFIALVFLMPGTNSYCVSQEKTAYSGELTYSYPRRYSRSRGYDKATITVFSLKEKGEISLDDTENSNGINLRCEVLFEPYYDGDGIKLIFESVDLESPERSGDYSTCNDKIVVYDGLSMTDPKLATLCGYRTVTLESSGSAMLLVFSSDAHGTRSHFGYTVAYSSIDRGGSDSSSGLGPGTMAAIILPSLLIYAVLFFIVYKRCKYAQRVRQNLAATGHTPEDMRMAMATMVEQASRRPLTSATAGNSGHHGGSSDLNQVLMEHMNTSRDRRLAASGGGDRRQQSRVRHPAGDLNSGYGNSSPMIPPQLEVEDSDFRGSRQGLSHGYPAAEDFPPDNHHNYLHHPHPHPHYRDVEDDRRSHGSGRSGRSQGRRTPSPRAHGHSAAGDRHSPYGHFQERMGEARTTLTYYGEVDGHQDGGAGADAAVSASAPSYHEVVQPEPQHTELPPPSYEEAATGKYDPRNQ